MPKPPHSQLFLWQLLLDVAGIEALHERLAGGPGIGRNMEYIRCPLCGADDPAVLARRAHPGVRLRNVICKQCGLIYINPRMNQDGYREFYTSEGFFEYLDPFHRPSEGYRQDILQTTDDNADTPTKRRVLPFLIDYVPNGGRVLDVGAGFGNLLYLLRKQKGCEVYGLEPGAKLREIARELMGITLWPNAVEEYLAKPSDLRFDMIILNQTFEHLLEPLQVLQGLARRLAPEGVVYIGVPNAFNPSVHMSVFYQVPHTFNYTPHTMKRIGERARLKIIKISDPTAYPLHVLLARQDARYPAVSPDLLRYGADWSEVAHILRRKRVHNVVRGSAGKVLRTILGGRRAEAIKQRVDALMHYRY